MLTHVDLFSGIGGFALAVRWAGFRTVVFCEIDEYCQEVLKARFGVIADSESMGWRDGATKNKRKTSRKVNAFGNVAPLLIPEIRDFDGTKWRGATLLTGGFPCQPFSVAGKRGGKEDNRYLWPEMFRVISEAKPRWVLGENVNGIINMALEQVCADLEGEGYEVQPIIIPACAVNAPHRRDRVWIIAHNKRLGWQTRPRKGMESKEQITKRQDIRDSDSKGDASNTKSRKTQSAKSRRLHAESCGENQNAPDSDRKSFKEYIGRNQLGHEREKISSRWRIYEPTWEENWPEVATRLCRMDDGVPAWIHARRVQRLKALGNSIVPQVAYEIIKGIAEIERQTG